MLHWDGDHGAILATEQATIIAAVYTAEPTAFITTVNAAVHSTKQDGGDDDLPRKLASQSGHAQCHHQDDRHARWNLERLQLRSWQWKPTSASGISHQVL
jgi:hypothetical protein